MENKAVSPEISLFPNPFFSVEKVNLISRLARQTCPVHPVDLLSGSRGSDHWHFHICVSMILWRMFSCSRSERRETHSVSLGPSSKDSNLFSNSYMTKCMRRGVSELSLSRKKILARWFRRSWERRLNCYRLHFSCKAELHKLFILSYCSYITHM